MSPRVVRPLHLVSSRAVRADYRYPSHSIAADPENLAAITALAGMGILTADDGLVDAALSEILALPADAKRARDPARRVDDLLVQHHLAQVSISCIFLRLAASGTSILGAAACIVWHARGTVCAYMSTHARLAFPRLRAIARAAPRSGLLPYPALASLTLLA